MALRRTGSDPVMFLWNEPFEKLRACDGYVLTGGFSYEDRSRAGAIAALDPLLGVLKEESLKGKPVLGICNGAQILVESGLVPGTADFRLAMALTDNKRVRNGHVLGAGYYNAWTHLSLATPPDRTVFARSLDAGTTLNIPLAHAQGRFVMPEAVLNQLRANRQIVFRYSDSEGRISSEFPVNPNGSLDNIAAVCNPAGNVMAMMPHPERTPKGDGIFLSLGEAIRSGNFHRSPATFRWNPDPVTIRGYQAPPNSRQLIVRLIITDNEALSVESALKQRGLTVRLRRFTHWELTGKNDLTEAQLGDILSTGELVNTNKEALTEFQPPEQGFALLVQPNEDFKGRKKRETLTGRFGIQGLESVRRGVLWVVESSTKDVAFVRETVLASHILFNRYSHRAFSYE